jgi:TolA-binding protein
MNFLKKMFLISMLSGVSSGCGQAGPPSPKADGASPASVLAVAQDLEKGQKIKNAIAAYHQIVRYYPGTPEAARAAERIHQLQSAALRRTRVRPAKSGTTGAKAP